MFSDFYIEMLSVILVSQALAFAGLFAGIYYNTKRHPKKYMSWFMMASAGYFAITWLSGFKHISVLQYVYPLAMPLLLCHLPLFYWYVRVLTGERFRVKGKQWLHLLPALTVLLLQMSFFLLPDEQAATFLESETLTGSYSPLRVILVSINRLSFYLVFTGQLIYYVLKYRQALQNYRNRMEDVYSFKEKIDFRWMRTLMIGILLFFIGNDLAYILRVNYHLISTLFFSLGMIAINFFIGFHCIMQSVVLQSVTTSAVPHVSLAEEVISQFNSNSNGIAAGNVNGNGDSDPTKYKRSALKTEVRESIILGLNRLMEEQELYTEPQLSIDLVAEKLNVNSKYLSQAINEVYNHNFYNFINELRVQKAKSFLQMNSHGHFSVDGIASQVGFQSKSSFYTAFKKSTGITPAAFRAQKNIKLELSGEVA